MKSGVKRQLEVCEHGICPEQQVPCCIMAKNIDVTPLGRNIPQCGIAGNQREARAPSQVWKIIDKEFSRSKKGGCAAGSIFARSLFSTSQVPYL